MNGVGIRSTLTPLVRSESGRIHVGSEKGPELLQRTDAGPSTDGVGSLQESREMDHSEVASFLFSCAVEQYTVSFALVCAKIPCLCLL